MKIEVKKTGWFCLSPEQQRAVLRQAEHHREQLAAADQEPEPHPFDSTDREQIRGMMRIFEN